MPPRRARTPPAPCFLRVVGLLAATFLFSGDFVMQSVPAQTPAQNEDLPAGPRAAAWKTIDKALAEGKPKTALDGLQGIEQAAIADQAWAEAARAIATRILAETGDRPPDDPQRLVLLAGGLDKAPPETRGVLQAVLANWIWGYFQENRWRFQQRSAGAAGGPPAAAGRDGADVTADLAAIGTWDLPRIVTEIRRRFAAAVGVAGSPDRKALQSLPVADWSAIIRPGKLPDAYRPTVWDVVVRDALEFAASGERGLMAPEDAFELDAGSAALGTRAEFLAWDPTAGGGVTDVDAPLLEAARLYRDLIAFHEADADRTALLAADLDRILWAAGAAVSSGDADELRDRKEAALRGFVAAAGDRRPEAHETEALARFHLAQLVREGDPAAPGDDDPAEARAIARVGAERHPRSPGGAMCANLVTEIESKQLALEAERSWTAPWPSVRVSYRNLGKVHLRLAKADWRARLAAGKPHAGWLDDADRAAILALPSVRQAAFDLPATDDFRQRSLDLSIAPLDPATLEPGCYWLLASHDPGFATGDNVVHGTMIQVTRLAIVAEQGRMEMARMDLGQAAANGPQVAAAGFVVDLATGEPIAGAAVQTFVREQRGFVERGGAKTDKDGRYEIGLQQGHEHVVTATAPIDGRRHEAVTEATHQWRNIAPDSAKTIVLVTDRGIHRPGQTVFYKGIACASEFSSGASRAVAGRSIEVVLRDANGRDVATATHTTSDTGSFHGTFPVPTGSLPGQWSIVAQAPGPDGFSGGVGVRVEEYKRPKFRVNLGALEKPATLGGEVVLSGTATTYTGMAVSGARVRYRVERSARWPIWCRWFFPWLPFDAGARRIARGTAVTDALGRFTLSFPAVADRAVPRESLPIFAFRVVADVTDSSGETRSDERSVQVGYTDVEAAVTADDWQAVEKGEPAQVKIKLTTTTPDGKPRGATGTLTVAPLVQPEAVPRADLFGMPPTPRLRPAGGRRAGRPARPAPPPSPSPRADDMATWPLAEAVVREAITTDGQSGAAEATARLPAGIYKAVFEIPAVGAALAVRAERVIEVVDPAADRYGVKRPLALGARTATVEPGTEFAAVVGTGHARGRALVEVARSGQTLARFWTDAVKTQWPVTVKVGPEHRGGFTVRAWLVQDGRLHVASRTIDVPWTDKKLAVSWERFTRRLEPGAKEVWRAKVAPVLPLPAGEGRGEPGAAEMLALLYDQSLDALAPHAWPGAGLLHLFRQEASWLSLAFTNRGEGLQHIAGQFKTEFVAVPEATYREFVAPFGSPQRGGWAGGFGGSRMLTKAMMRRGGMPMAPMSMAAAPAAESAANAVAEGESVGANRKAAADEQAKGQAQGPAGGPPTAPSGAAAAAPPPRKNLVETAFFLPTLVADKEGIVTIEFTLPDTLTTWQFKGLAHDVGLRSGTIADTCIAAKDLMVEPVVPRFLREGDVVQIPVKVSNKSTGRLSGSVKLALFDARTDASRDVLVEGPREAAFDLAAGATQPVVFTIRVADGTETLRYLATGSAGRAADGEEAFLPVLARRVPVTETVPVTIRGPGERRVLLERLRESAPGGVQNQSLVVQAASNPAWYAVLALPSIAEQADESTETLFTRVYANALARHLATSDPRIARVFEQWKETAALASPLEKNSDLVQTLLAETPWVRDAVDEREARARIALLFDATRAENEFQAGLNRLASLRCGDGGWPWFPGGGTCDSVTLGILAGFGRLRAAGMKLDIQPALETLPWLDRRLVEERRWAEKLAAGKPESLVLTPIGVYAVYARSFFAADAPPAGEAAEAVRWALDVGRASWAKLAARISQGHLAIALHRAGDRATAASIVDSLKQRAVDADVKPGAESESWQGMWWRDRHPGWWSWAHAPIATQAIMIEAFDEVAGDRDSVEALKVWLLSQKRTSRWPGSRATADAVGALLGRGDDLLAARGLVQVEVGGRRIEPQGAEAGTGFFEERFVRREIEPAMAEIVVTKAEPGLAWGGVHWQYLDDISKVPAAGREELSIEKGLFVKRFTKAGPVLEPIPGEKGGDAAGAKDSGGTALEVGDELVVRLVVKSDRDYEFLELADHRPSLTEPVDTLSGWRWGDGAGWYLAVRDASTRLYFERLPRGTHVFEYSLRAAHRGRASSGFASIQSRYAPEFSAHSASIPVEVR